MAERRFHDLGILRRNTGYDADYGQSGGQATDSSLPV